MNKCKVSVIIVVKNEENYIGDCLESIVNQDLQSYKYEVIVVDGGSSDKTHSIVTSFPGVKLIVDVFGTLGHQRNTGIENSCGQYIAFTDADCVAHRSWLRNLLSVIEQSDNNIVGGGGPNYIMNDDPDLAKIIGYAQETFLGSGGSPQAANSNKVMYNVVSIPNCNAIYKLDIIKRYMYNDNFTIGEDAEFNYRLRKNGFKFFYTPHAKVWHHRVSSFLGFAQKMFIYGKAMGRVTKVHRSSVRWYAFAPALSIIFFPLIMLCTIYSSEVFFNIFLTLVFAGYITCLIYSTIQVINKINRKISLLTLFLLPTQHLMYGIGFIKGLFGQGDVK